MKEYINSKYSLFCHADFLSFFCILKKKNNVPVNPEILVKNIRKVPDQLEYGSAPNCITAKKDINAAGSHIIPVTMQGVSPNR
jgi:hypothetical protein